MSDLTVTRGDDRTFTTTVTDESGSIVDLTGVTAAAWTLKRDMADDDPIIARTLGDGITIAAPVTGEVKTALTAAQTGTLTGDYVWDLEIVAGGKTYTPDRGRLYVTGDVTGAGYAEVPTLSVAEFREHFTTPLTDAAVQRMIDANREAIDALVGGFDTYTERITGNTTYLALARPAGSISTVEERAYGSNAPTYTLDPTDYYLPPGGAYLQRLVDGVHPAIMWAAYVDVTYLPAEVSSDRRRVLIQLTKLDCAHDPAHTSMTIGDASYSFAPYRETRENLLASLLPSARWSFA